LMSKLSSFGGGGSDALSDEALRAKKHKIADDTLEKLQADKDPVYKQLMESKKRLALLSQKPQLMAAVVSASKHATLAGCRDLDASSRGDHLQLAHAAMPPGKGLTASELLLTIAFVYGHVGARAGWVGDAVLPVH
jgi:hypothetical protein